MTSPEHRHSPESQRLHCTLLPVRELCPVWPKDLLEPSQAVLWVGREVCMVDSSEVPTLSPAWLQPCCCSEHHFPKALVQRAGKEDRVEGSGLRW